MTKEEFLIQAQVEYYIGPGINNGGDESKFKLMSKKAKLSALELKASIAYDLELYEFKYLLKCERYDIISTYCECLFTDRNVEIPEEQVKLLPQIYKFQYYEYLKKNGFDFSNHWFNNLIKAETAKLRDNKIKSIFND